MIGSIISGSSSITNALISLLLRIPAVLLAISVHEAAHGYVAFKLGDPTAKLMGRITIKPWAHFDLFGALCMLVFGFGWAKPVPFDVRLLKKPKRDVALVAAAGPAANLLVGTLFVGIRLVISFLLAFVFEIPNHPIIEYFLMMLDAICILNISLMIFNLIPLPPLDGSKVLLAFLPAKAHRFVLTYERYGMPILMILLLISDRLPWFLSIDTLLNWAILNVHGFIFDIWYNILAFIFSFIV